MNDNATLAAARCFRAAGDVHGYATRIHHARTAAERADILSRAYGRRHAARQAAETARRLAETGREHRLADEAARAAERGRLSCHRVAKAAAEKFPRSA